MNYSFQRSANAAVGSAGWVRTAPVEGGQVQGWFGHTTRKPWNREMDVRLEQQRQEHTDIARELHDALPQGFVGASIIQQRAVDELPADSHSKDSLSPTERLIYRVIDEGRNILDGLRSHVDAQTDLEKAFADMGDDFTADGPELRIWVMGRAAALNPALQEQVYLIGREALINALQHSGATMIEAEIEYLPNKLRVIVRDNGSGVDLKMFESGRNSHWGLVGMLERANSIGAELQMRSRKGAGTEVEISLPTTSPD